MEVSILGLKVQVGLFDKPRKKGVPSLLKGFGREPNPSKKVNASTLGAHTLVQDLLTSAMNPKP